MTQEIVNETEQEVKKKSDANIVTWLSRIPQMTRIFIACGIAILFYYLFYIQANIQQYAVAFIATILLLLLLGGKVEGNKRLTMEQCRVLGYDYIRRMQIEPLGQAKGLQTGRIDMGYQGYPRWIDNDIVSYTFDFKVYPSNGTIIEAYMEVENLKGNAIKLIKERFKPDMFPELKMIPAPALRAMKDAQDYLKGQK